MYKTDLKVKIMVLVWLVRILEVTLLQSCYPPHHTVLMLLVQYAVQYCSLFDRERASKFTLPLRSLPVP